jgi:hypothetical protein
MVGCFLAREIPNNVTRAYRAAFTRSCTIVLWRIWFVALSISLRCLFFYDIRASTLNFDRWRHNRKSNTLHNRASRREHSICAIAMYVITSMHTVTRLARDAYTDTLLSIVCIRRVRRKNFRMTTMIESVTLVRLDAQLISPISHVDMHNSMLRLRTVLSCNAIST